MENNDQKDKFVGGQSQDFDPWSIETNESKSDFVTIQKFDPNQTRDERGRWADMIGSTDEADPNRDKTKSHTIDVKNALTLHDELGGSSFAMDGENQVGKVGAFSVSIYPEASLKVPGKFVTDTQYNDFIKKYSDLINDSEYPAIVGTWYDTDADLTWLDVSVVVDRTTAFDLAELYNQKEIYDLENLEEINTGGTGEVIKNYLKNLDMKNDDKKPKADTGKVTLEQYKKFAKTWAQYNKNRK